MENEDKDKMDPFADPFANFVMRQEFERWITLLNYWEHYGGIDGRYYFLADWAWKLESHDNSYEERRWNEKFIKTVEERIKKLLSFTDKDFPYAINMEPEEEKDIYTLISILMKDRKERFFDTVFNLVNLHAVYIRRPDNEGTITYIPHYKKERLKINEKVKSELDRLRGQDRIHNRSDVIIIGIILGLTRKGLDYLLEITGFYKLYIRDFFEFVLIKTMIIKEKEEKESLIKSDKQGKIISNTGYSWLLRGNRDSEALQEFGKYLINDMEKVYEKQLSPKNIELMKKMEPGWLKWLKTNLPE